MGPNALEYESESLGPGYVLLESRGPHAAAENVARLVLLDCQASHEAQRSIPGSLKKNGPWPTEGRLYLGYWSPEGPLRPYSLGNWGARQGQRHRLQQNLQELI